MTKEEHVKTILHELVHVVQNEQGLIDDDDERESQAYMLEGDSFQQLLCQYVIDEECQQKRKEDQEQAIKCHAV